MELIDQQGFNCSLLRIGLALITGVTLGNSNLLDAKIWGGLLGKKAPSIEYEKAYDGFAQQYRIAPIKKLYLDRLQDEVNQYNYYYALMTSKPLNVENWPKYSDVQKAKQEFIRDMIVSWVGG